MNKLLKFPALLAVALFAAGCTDNAADLISEEHGSETPRSRTITPEQAINNVQAFIEAFENNWSAISRTDNFVKRSISDVQVFEKTQSSHLSRSVELPDTLFYIVNFADSAGYVVAGAQEGMEPIYAFIESGTGDSNSLINKPNPGVGMYWEDAVFVYEDAPIINRPDNKWYITEVKKPMIAAQWGQGSFGEPAYGKYFRNNIAGCATVAAAQILYHFSKPGFIQWTEADGTAYSSQIIWSRIKMDCGTYNGILHPNLCPNSFEEVAKLMRYIGINCNADDSEINTTSITPENLISWFNKQAWVRASALAKYNETDIIQNMKSENPILMCATNSADMGHAWVLDGFISATHNGESKKLVFCNWGYSGDYNGYYLSKVFNYKNGPVFTSGQIDALSRNSSGDGNYCNKQQYSVITKNSININ